MAINDPRFRTPSPLSSLNSEASSNRQAPEDVVLTDVDLASDAKFTTNTAYYSSTSTNDRYAGRFRGVRLVIH